MKSMLIVLLLVLASYCYSGTLACEPVNKIANIAILKSNDEFKKELSKYTTDPTALNASIKTKSCADKLSFFEKTALASIALKEWKKC